MFAIQNTRTWICMSLYIHILFWETLVWNSVTDVMGSMGVFTFGRECLRKSYEEGSTGEKNMRNYSMVTVFLPCFVITKSKGTTMISTTEYNCYIIKRNDLVSLSPQCIGYCKHQCLCLSTVRDTLHNFSQHPQDGVQLLFSTAQHKQMF